MSSAAADLLAKICRSVDKADTAAAEALMQEVDVEMPGIWQKFAILKGNERTSLAIYKLAEKLTNRGDLGFFEDTIITYGIRLLKCISANELNSALTVASAVYSAEMPTAVAADLANLSTAPAQATSEWMQDRIDSAALLLASGDITFIKPEIAEAFTKWSRKREVVA